MKKIEIYNYDTNDTFMIIETNKRKNLQREIINYLKVNHFNLVLQGRVVPNIEEDIYWLAFNKQTKEQLKLWYREIPKDKNVEKLEKDIVDDMF